MKKFKIIKIVASIGLSAILLMGCGSKSVSTTQAPSQNQTSKEEKQVKLDKDNAINVSYEKNDDYKAIYDLFKNQEIKAKEQYINKTLNINGEIDRIQKENGYIVIYIMTKSHSYDAHLYFKDNEENESKIANLKRYSDSFDKGDIISVYGIFEEFAKRKDENTYYIKVTNCEFIKGVM